MNENFYERLKNFLNDFDLFAKTNNMRLTQIREGYAEAVFEADETRHLNGLKIVQGGALYTLADFAFAGAVNSYGVKAVGMSCNISYLRPGTGTTFHAEARVLHHGKRTGVFSVDVFDSRNRLLIHAILTGAYLEEPILPDCQ